MKKLIALSIVCFLTACSHHQDEDSNSINTTMIEKLTSNDVALGEPEPFDWLASHNEPGQSFEQYKKIKPVTTSKSRNKIYLQPLGKFTATQKDILLYTSDYLKIFFDLPVITLPPLDENIIPTSARRYSGTDAEQFKTEPILNYLQRNIPKDAVVIMAITAKDLYPNEQYNYVFGQARTKNRVGVSSIFRYATTELNSTNYNVCLDRLIKTSSHEIGHMFSCLHCTYAVCVMNGSNSLWESDSRPNRLCSNCLKKLQWNLKFDVITRLEKLKNYFEKHQLKNNRQLTLNDLNTVKKVK